LPFLLHEEPKNTIKTFYHQIFCHHKIRPENLQKKLLKR
jgi:hypothetical protein